MYAYALAKNDTRCFVYEFNPRGFNYSDNASFNGYYTINIPQGLDESAVFASTPPYSGLLFYASGNTVYRLDFKQAGGKATAIYTHAGGKAVKMKFAKRYLSSSNAFDAYEFDVQYSLGIGFDMGNGKGDFVILNLSSTGSVGGDSEHYPAKQVYTDFGEITDFVFI